MASRPKTPADIRESHYRRNLPIAIATRLTEFRAVCAEWHNRFGGCLTLDRLRLNALTALMVDGPWKIDAVLAAIEAYAAHVATDDWHRQHPRAVKKLTSFLGDTEALHRYAELGLCARRQREIVAKSKQIAADQAAAEQAARDRARAERQALVDRFWAQPPHERQALIDQATAALTVFQRDIVRANGKVGMDSPLIRSGVLTLLANELNRQDAKGAKEIPT